MAARDTTFAYIMSKGKQLARLPFVTFHPPMIKQTLNSNGEETNSSAPRRIWRYGPLLLWLVFMSFASTSEFSAANTSQIVRPLLLWLFPNISEPRIAAIHFFTRKAAHFTEYAILAFLARRAFITSSRHFIQRHWFQLGLALVVLYALLDEYHQSFVPSRTPSIYDSAIDIAGGLTVLLIFKVHNSRAQQREAARG